MLAARSSSGISAKATTKGQVSPLCYAEVYSVALSCLNVMVTGEFGAYQFRRRRNTRIDWWSLVNSAFGEFDA